jgi:hypothetical protein
VETIGDFVSRTGGPVVPFVEAWYPWAYAHHYLRGEITQLPGELGTVGTSLSLEEARDLIELWCGHTGESIEDGARRLADAYLRRWGLHPSEPTPNGTQGAGATQAEPTPARQRRATTSGATSGAAGGAGRRGRATRAAAETATAPRGEDPYAMSVPDREG